LIALWCALAAAEQPLHDIWVGADARVIAGLDELPHHPELQSLGYTPPRLQPSLAYGNVTLWGHAELWMTVTPWDGVALWDQGAGHGANLQTELGGRAFLRKFEDGMLVPWVGPSIAPVSYNVGDGPTRSHLRMQHAVGLAYRDGPWMWTLSVGWVPLVRTRYPLGRENFADEDEDFFFDGSGPLYTPDQLVVKVGVRRFVGQPGHAPRGQVDPWFAVGVAGARSVGQLSSFNVDRSFIDGPAPPVIYPEGALGLDLPKLLSIEACIRHMRQRQEAYGLVADWTRSALSLSLLLENPYPLGQVRMFVGGGVSGDLLRYADADFDVPVQVHETSTLRPTGSMGIRYQPTQADWLRVRTYLRVTPLLMISEGFAFRASFPSVEVGLLRLEVHPRRF